MASFIPGLGGKSLKSWGVGIPVLLGEDEDSKERRLRKKRARQEWIQNDRWGHAPGCKLRIEHLREVHFEERVDPRAKRVHTFLRCCGCGGKFSPPVSCESGSHCSSCPTWFDTPLQE